MLMKVIGYVDRFVIGVERIADALEKGLEQQKEVFFNLSESAGTLSPGFSTGETGPAQTGTGSPDNAQAKRNRPTKEEMAQTRAEALAAITEAGLVLSEIEAQVKGTADSWTTKQCEKVMALAGKNGPTESGAPTGSPQPLAETPKTEQEINAAKIAELVSALKAKLGDVAGEAMTSSIISAFGGGASLESVPANVQLTIIASLEAGLGPKTPTAPVTEKPKSQETEPCPVDEKVFAYVSSLVGHQPMTPEMAAGIIKTMKDGKLLALEQIRAVASASVNSKKIAEAATAMGLVATRANKPGAKLPEVDPALYVAIIHDFARQAETEAM